MDFTESLKIEHLRPSELTPYEKNARKHGTDDVKTIVASIRDFGFNDPIGIWGKRNLIVEGHGRYMAALELGMEEIPCIRLDHLTEKERKAYALAHNKTAEMSTWDFDILGEELSDLSDMAMEDYGFNVDDEADDLDDELDISKYTQNIRPPQYEIQGDMPEIEDLVDFSKSASLIEQIEQSNVTEEEKAFLKIAAYRHDVFNYGKIAEYYAHAAPEMQELMEKSALVIIDIDDAIAEGYVVLERKIMEMLDEDGE